MKAWKSFFFEAAHTLPDAPVVHGHSYKATLHFETSKESPVELRQIEKLEWQLHRAVDHQNLNSIIPSPTMEAIADYLQVMAQRLIEMQSIRLVLLSVSVERPTLMFGVSE